ncbi:LTA synthase family protein, partial [Vibrio parahaemolyticus]|nr:LTA synthase family protein [Vibrio parahaemolyticus]
PPHVVMALMEGMGNNVLIEDDAQNNDLLGALREGFEQDFVFKRFMAGTSATIDSIVMMLLHSDVPTISHSSAQKVALPSSAVLPYKHA